MKQYQIRLMAVVLGALVATPVWAASSVCLRGYQISNTERPNDNTILFHMNDGSTYKVNTVGRCVGLAMDSEGFTFSPTDPGSDEYCSNLVTIQLNTTHSVCLLGEFVKLPKTPPK